jgi:hypothetical protein
MLLWVSLREGGLPRLVARVSIEDRVEEDGMRAAATTHRRGGGTVVFRVLGRRQFSWVLRAAVAAAREVSGGGMF